MCIIIELKRLQNVFIPYHIISYYETRYLYTHIYVHTRTHTYKDYYM